jgi:hypothetical protein
MPVDDVPCQGWRKMTCPTLVALRAQPARASHARIALPDVTRQRAVLAAASRADRTDSFV